MSLWIEQIAIANYADYTSTRSLYTHRVTSHGYFADAVYKSPPLSTEAQLLQAFKLRQPLTYEVRLFSTNERTKLVNVIVEQWVFSAQSRVITASSTEMMTQALKIQNDMRIARVASRTAEEWFLRYGLWRVAKFGSLIPPVGADAFSVPWEIKWQMAAESELSRRSATECRLQFENNLFFEVINRALGYGTEVAPFSKDEDRRLVALANEHKERDWDDIARRLSNVRLSEFAKNDPQFPSVIADLAYPLHEQLIVVAKWLEHDFPVRSPLECLQRYQRRLNSSFLRSKWTPEEDNALIEAVNVVGMHNWSEVAYLMGPLSGRVGQQCLQRYCKGLDPSISRKPWTKHEDRKLILAVHACGESWSEVSHMLRNRSDVQCRERYVNLLKDGVEAASAKWDDAEDALLLQLVDEYGVGKWALIARRLNEERKKSGMSSRDRTDNQCWRRWKQLQPEEHVDAYLERVFKRKSAQASRYRAAPTGVSSSSESAVQHPLQLAHAMTSAVPLDHPATLDIMSFAGPIRTQPTVSSLPSASSSTSLLTLPMPLSAHAGHSAVYDVAAANVVVDGGHVHQSAAQNRSARSLVRAVDLPSLITEADIDVPDDDAVTSRVRSTYNPSRAAKRKLKRMRNGDEGIVEQAYDVSQPHSSSALMHEPAGVENAAGPHALATASSSVAYLDDGSSSKRPRIDDNPQ